MNIVIRSPNWLGDIIMSIPAIKSLKNKYPNSRIFIVCKKGLEKIYTFLNEVDKIIPYEKGVNNLIKISRHLSKKNIDIFVSFPNSFESALLGFLSNIPVRIGYSKDMRCPILTRCVKRTPEILNKHHIFYYLNLLIKSNFIEEEITDIRLNNFEKLKSITEKTYEIFFKKEKKIKIGIHPGAAYGRTKMWPIENYIELIKLILKNYDSSIYLIGSKNEMEISLKIKESISDVNILTGKTTIDELVGVINNFDLFISNDSGPMHLAASLSIPQIAIFGSTDPVITSPWNEKAKIVKGITHCSPCFLKECPFNTFDCLKKTNPEIVFNLIKEYLN